MVPVLVPASVPVGSFESSVFGSGRVEGANENHWIGEIRRRLFPKEQVSSSSMTGNMTFLGRAPPPVMTHGNPGGVRAVIDVYRKTECGPRREVVWFQS